MPPTRPSARMSPIPVTPQISENTTSGTTSIFSALTNILPIMAKRPPVTCSAMNSEPVALKISPTTMPSPIPSITCMVRDIFLTALAIRRSSGSIVRVRIARMKRGANGLGDDGCFIPKASNRREECPPVGPARSVS